MSLPVQYKVEFTGNKYTDVLDQTNQNAWLAFGTPSFPKVRIKFTITDVSTEPLYKYITIKFKLRCPGAAPTGIDARAKLYDKNYTLLVTSPDIRYPSPVASFGSAGYDWFFTFELDDYEGEYEIDDAFYIELYTDGGTAASCYEVGYQNTEQTTQLDLDQWNGSVWNSVTGDAYMIDFYSHRLKTFDITTACRDFRASIGTEDVEGTLVEGQMECTLRDLDGDFSPVQESSPYYPYWDVMARIHITATYSSTEYDQFFGYITRIRPNIDIDAKEVFVSASDRSFLFKDHKVNVTANGKKADEIIELILTELKLNPSLYDIDDTDPQVLANKTWTEEDGIDALANVVEAGQHNQFIGPDGVYYFKSSFWLGGLPVPDYSYETGDCSEIAEFKIEQDVKKVANRFRTYGAAWRELVNLESLHKYGQRDLEINNDLVPSNGYADDVNLILAAKFSNRINGADMSMRNVYPDMLDLGIGTVIEITDDETGLDAESFIVHGTDRNVQMAGEHTVDIKLKRHYSPPYFWEISDDSATVGGWKTWRNTNWPAQQLKMELDGYISSCQVKFDYQGFSFPYPVIYFRLYPDDGTDLPDLTGYLLGFGNGGFVPAASGTFNDVVVMNYLGIQEFIPKDTKFWLSITLSGSFTGSEQIRMYGLNTNPYADGISAYFNNPTFTKQPTIDYYVKSKVIPGGDY